MKTGVVAIPLFAAMWLAAPALGAQDQDTPRTAVPRNAQPRAEPQAAPRAEPRARRADPPPPADTASAGEQRSRGGRDTDGRGGGGGRVTPRGYTRPEPQVVERRGRDGRGPVARGPVNRGPVNRGPVIINNYSSYRRQAYYPPAYYDRWARNYFRWSPLSYAPWSLIYGSVGFSNFGFHGSIGSYPYRSYGSYGYPYYSGSYPPYYASGYDLGGVRLQLRPRDAEVFVDGYYAGIVDDFDGTFQQLRLEPGGHKIEVRMPGFEDLDLDVHVQPGRTITIHEDLRPRP